MTDHLSAFAAPPPATPSPFNAFNPACSSAPTDLQPSNSSELSALLMTATSIVESLRAEQYTHTPYYSVDYPPGLPPSDIESSTTTIRAAAPSNFHGPAENGGVFTTFLPTTIRATASSNFDGAAGTAPLDEGLAMGRASPDLRLPDDREVVAFVSTYLHHDQATSDAFFKHRVLSLKMRGNRLLVIAEVNGIPTRILLDTGATISCVSAEFVARHPASLQSQLRDSGVIVPIEVADSRSVRSLSSLPGPTICFPGQTDTVSVPLHLLSLPNKVDVILGVDWLRANRVSLDFSPGDTAHVAFGGSSTKALTSSQRATRPPRHVAYVAPLVDDDDDDGYCSDPDCIEIFDHRDLPYLHDEGVPTLCFLGSDTSDPATATVGADFADRTNALKTAYPRVFEPPIGVPVRDPPTVMTIPLIDHAELPPPRNFGVPRRQQNVLTAWLAKCVQNGWVAEGYSPVNSPVFCVPKKDGSWRVVVDLRQINLISKSFTQSSIESIDRIVEKLTDAVLLSNLDAADGFYQVPLLPKDSYLTAFTVDSRQYRFLVAPQGLKNTPLVFQNLMNSVLRRHHLLDQVELRTVMPFMEPEIRQRYAGWDPHTIVGTTACYIDDIIAGTYRTGTDAEHAELHHAHLLALLHACDADDIHLKWSKCCFYRVTVAFLGEIVGNGERRVNPEKVASVAAWPPPTKVRELQAFLGFCNFFRRHIESFSETAAPLYSLAKKGVTWEWGPSQQTAFTQLRHSVTSAPVLRLPAWDRPFTLVTDCSATAAGAVLMQPGDDGKLSPISYWSTTLKGAELRYSARDLEAFALVKATTHYRYYLWGAPFKVRMLTDHRSLQFLRGQRDVQGRLARWQDILSEFDYDIQYYPGKLNVVADCLSRYPSSTPPSNRGTTGAVLRHLVHAPASAATTDRSVPPAISDVPALLAPVLTRRQLQIAIVKDMQEDRVDLHAAPVPINDGPAKNGGVSATFLSTTEVSTTPSSPTISAAPPPTAATTTPPADPEHPLPLLTHTLLSSSDLQYHDDKDFGPIVELLTTFAQSHRLSQLRLSEPTQLDPKLFPARLRKYLPKLKYYELIGGRLYNLSPDHGFALCVPDQTSTFDGTTVPLRDELIRHFHDDMLSAHRGAGPTHLRLRRHFYWHRMSRDVKAFVNTCEVCHRSKSRTAAPYGLMEALEPSSGPGQSYTMDFIFDLAPDPLTKHDGILAVVDRFSSLVALIPVYSTCTAKDVAELLELHVFLKRGHPRSIVCDRDPRFSSKHFRDFARCRGFHLSMSSGNHPESDGKSERKFRSLEEAVRCYIDYGQTTLFKILPYLEFALNDGIDPVTQCSSFYTDKGYNPMRPIDVATIPYHPATVQSVQDHLDTVRSVWSMARDAIREAQSKYVARANESRRPVPPDVFAVGEEVYVHRANFVPPALRGAPTRKFQSRFFGSYTIKRKISPTSYELDLPYSLRQVHPVFHVSQFKPRPRSDRFPERRVHRVDPIIIDGEPEFLIERILNKRTHRRRVQYLVKWSGYPLSEASWEPRASLADSAPSMLQEFEDGRSSL